MVTDTLFCGIETIKFGGCFLMVFFLLPQCPMKLIHCFIPFPTFSSSSYPGLFLCKYMILSACLWRTKGVLPVRETWAPPVLKAALHILMPSFSSGHSRSRQVSVSHKTWNASKKPLAGDLQPYERETPYKQWKKTRLFKLLGFLLHNLKKSN